MKYRGLKRAIVMLLALTMLVTSTGMATFAESLNEEATNPSQDAVTTEQAEEAQAEEAKSDAVTEDAKEEAKEEAKDEASDKAAEDQKLTAKDWEKDLPKDVSKDVREAMAQVAKSQVGDEADLYKAFANADSIKDGDASFVMFVLEYANVLGVKKAIGDDNNGTVKAGDLEFPVNADIKKWVKELKNADIYKEVENDAMPEQGDIVFTHSIGNNDAAVVLSVDEGKLEVAGIETEKKEDKVSKYTVDAEKVDGFVSLKDIAPEEFAEEQAEAAEAAENTEEALTDEEKAAEEAAKAEEEAKKAEAEAAGFSDQTVEAKITSAPGVSGKLRSIFTSTKDTEITISGMLPEDATAKAYPVNVEIPGQNVLTAYDITIYTKDENGKEVEWQPDLALNVSIKDAKLAKAEKNGSNLGEMNVYHMDNKSAEPEHIGTVTPDADAASFDADKFSIYVISEDADTRTYRFVEDTTVENGKWTTEYTGLRQVLQNGDKLVEPTAPAKEGSVFEGWFEYKNGSLSTEEFKGWGPVSGIPAHAEGADPTSEEVILVAKFSSNKVKVTYYDQTGSIVQVQQITKGHTIDPNEDQVDADDDSITRVKYTPIQNEDGSYLVFQYWTQHPYGAKDKAEDVVCDSNIELYPVTGKAHYIHFDTNRNSIGGIDTSYVGSIVVQPDSKPVAGDDENQYKPASIIPEASGYTFDGWYIKSDSSTTEKVFNADGTLNESGWNKLLTKTGDSGLTYDPTLYAHWKADTAKYSVVYYTLKAEAGEGRNTETDYEFYKDMGTREATTGSQVTRGSDDTVAKAFTDADDKAGFELSSVNNPTVTVKGDGSSTLAVYFDRKTFNLGFYYYSSSNVNRYGTADNTVKQRGTIIKNIEALYGENISANFPIDQNNKAISWTDADKSTYAYIFAAMNLMPARNDVFYTSNSSTGNGYFQNVYYLQVTDNESDYAKATTDKDSYKSTFNVTYYNNTNRSRNITLYDYVIGSDGNVYHLERTMRHSFGFITMGEEYYEIFGFDRNLEDTSPQFGYNGHADRACSNSGDNSGLYKLFYSRKPQTIHLKDTLNNRSKDVTFLYDEQIKADDSRVEKFAAVENNEQIDSDHYWFYDAACTNPVDFRNLKMPNHEMTFYAGLRKAYFVKLYPDGGELLYKSGKSGNTYATWYRLYDGESIVPYEDVRRDYIAVDSVDEDTETFWYDENYYQSGDENKPRDQIKRYTAYQTMDAEHSDAQKYIYSPGAYEFVGWFQVPDGQDASSYEIPDGASPYDVSTHVKGNLTLKAKWRPMSQYNIVYDALEGNHAPEDLEKYVDGANIRVKASVDQPTGKQFKWWKDSANHIYKPGETVTASESISTVNDDGSRTLTLTAVYEDGEFKDNQTADYIFMNGGAEYYRQTLSRGEKLVTPTEPTPEDGKSFIGWFEDPACTVKFNGFGTISEPAETYLYAGFAKEYTVTYYDAKQSGNSWVKGDNVLQVEKYVDGAELNTSKVTYNIDENRYVANWNVKNGEEKTVGYQTENTDYEVHSDLTLWPNMRDYELLRFDSNGGSYVAPVRVPSEEGRWPNRPVEPTREGYRFLGWFTSKDLVINDGEVVRDKEYDFNKPLSELSGFTGTLYAWWLPTGNTSLEAKYTVIWWAQTATGAEDYEYQKAETYMGKIGTEVDVLSSAWKSANGDPTSLDNLTSYHAKDESKYFEYTTDELADLGYGKRNHTAAIVTDDGNTVINLYFNRVRYEYIFNCDSLGKITYKGHEYTNGDNKYTLTTWLNKQVSDEWPIVDESRAGMDGDPYPYITMNGSNKFKTWYDSAGNINHSKLELITPKAQLDRCVNKKKNLTMQKTGTGEKHVYLLYYFDGEEKESYRQEIETSTKFTSTNADGITYLQGFSVPAVEGYSVVDSSTKAATSGDVAGLYNPYYDGANRAVYRKVTISGNTQVPYTYHTYSLNEDEQYDFYYRESNYNWIGIFTGYSYYPISIRDKGTGAENGFTVGYTKNGRFNAINSGDIFYVDKGKNINDASTKIHVESYDAFVRSSALKDTQETRYKTVTQHDEEQYLFLYTKNTWKVRLMMDEATPYSDRPTVDVKYGELVSDYVNGIVPESPDPGKVFDCWSVTSKAPEPYTRAMPDNDIILYATWKDKTVKVTTPGYDHNGDPLDEGETATPYENSYGKLLREFAIANPKSTQPGWTFGGWQNADTKEKISLNTQITEDISIEPIWVDLHVSPLVYDLNGGSGDIDGTVPHKDKDNQVVEGQFEDSGNYLEGASAEVKSGASLKKTVGEGADAVDYRFVCWNTKADGTGTDHYTGDMIELTKKSIVLYARYVEVRKTALVYDLNTDDSNAHFQDYDGNTSTADKEYVLTDSGDSSEYAGRINSIYTVGTEINDSKEPTALTQFSAVRPGYKLAGWSTNKDAKANDANLIHDGDKIRVDTLEKTGNTLYAIWDSDDATLEAYPVDNGVEGDENEDLGGKLTVTQGKTWTAEAFVQEYLTAANKQLPDEMSLAYVKIDNTKVKHLRYEPVKVTSNNYIIGYKWQYSTADEPTADDWTTFAARTLLNPSGAVVKFYYEKQKYNLTVSNETEGQYADLTRKFTVTVTVTKADSTKEIAETDLPKIGNTPMTLSQDKKSATYEAQLGNGESFIVAGIIGGWKYSITEGEHNGYDLTFKTGTAAATETAPSGVALNDNTTVVLTNDFDSNQVVPSGISGHMNMLMLIVLAFVLATAEFYILMRRRRVSR